MLTSEDFINRSADLSWLSANYQDAETKTPTVAIISAETGVGKSALVRHWSNAQDAHHLRAEVKDVERRNGLYISKLAAAANTLAESSGNLPTLDSYFRSLPTESVKGQHDQRLLQEAFSTPPLKPFKPIGSMLKRKMRLTHSDLKAKLYPGTDTGFWELADYLELFLEKAGRLIVSVENVQSLDPLSKDILTELITHNSLAFFIWEYTTGEDCNFLLDDLVHECEMASARVPIRRLQWLPLKDILKSGTTVNFERLLEKAYYETSGNLRALKDLEILLLDEPAKEAFNTQEVNVISELDATGNPTVALLESLRKSDLFLTVSLAVHGAHASEYGIMAMYDRAAHFQDFFLDVEASLSRLLDLGLIERQSDEQYALCHDSTAKALLSSDSFVAFRELAYSSWTALYEALLEEEDFLDHSKSQILTRLASLYCIAQPKKLLNLFEEIRSLALNSRYPREIVSYVEKLWKELRRAGQQGREINASTQQDLEKEVEKELLGIYYQSGLYREAYEVLRAGSLNDKERELLELALLDRLEEHAAALQRCEEIWIQNPTTATDYRVNLCVKLIEMTSLRSLNRIEACWQAYEAIRAEPIFREFREYGYFLRNSEILLPPRAALNATRESAEFFKSQNRQRDEAHSRISIAMYLIRLGEFSSALNELDLALKLLGGAFMERHIVANNRAVAEVLAGESRYELITQRLHHALRTVANSFDRIVLLNNIGVVSSLASRWGYADDVFEAAHRSLRGQPDRALLRTVLFNQSISYRDRGDRKRASQFLRRAVGVFQVHEPLWKQRLFGHQQEDEDGSASYASFLRYHLSMITFWHFEIPKVLSADGRELP